MPFLGMVIGFVVGAMPFGWSGGIAGAFVGLIVALAIRSRTQARARLQAPPGTAAEPASGAGSRGAARAPADGDDPTWPGGSERLDGIERRLQAIEHALAGRVHGVAHGVEAATTAPQDGVATRALADAPPSRTTALADATVSPGFARALDGTLEPAPPPGATLPLRADDAQRSQAPRFARDADAPARTPPNPVWAWLRGGNTLTRVGVIVLFFGVAFLLKYFAELVTIPIELKLAGVALVGAALCVLGAHLARARPGYGLSLQGAGAGMLYLTTFAAFRLYEVLPAPVAFALLVAVAAFTVWRATRADSQALAGLAIAGGFLAPFLVSTSAGTPLVLFGYFAVLNAVIFALAWVRAWRALNVLGFVFTFALGLFWGERFYRPEHFAVVEPFLVLFFAFYVAIAVLHATKSPLQAKAPVDAVLVFGVPLVGFALQAALVRDIRYGAAWSALVAAAVYGVLAVALFRRQEPGLRLLARAFLVLAIIFATIAIPFAADPQWTSAWWALEAAAVYWIGCRQRQRFARAFALLLQVGAAAAFVAADLDAGPRPFLNASFLGTTLIALAALATAFVADRHRDDVTANERALIPVLVVWGLAWWFGGGVLELRRTLPQREEANAILAFVVASVAGAWVLQRMLRWPRLAHCGAVLLPAIVLAALVDWERMHTSLLAYGWLVFPAAWVAQWRVLRLADALRPDAGTEATRPSNVAAYLKHAHTASALALVAWLGWEASEWVGRYFAVGTVWIACAAAWPAIGYLWLAARATRWQGWPLRDYRDAYASSAGTAIAAFLVVWFAIVNVVSPGLAAPLPYVPVANPLDVTLIAALAALFTWARAVPQVAERTLYRWWGAAVFVLVNAIVFRTVHQWLDVPWRLSSLLASKPLQAALTLTWTVTALPLMLLANKRGIRPLWMVGVGLLAVVVVKLFIVDLAALSGLPRVIAFLGAGALLLVIGYLAPLPPAERGDAGAGTDPR